eukprot:12047677-Ditylum_brightwellii.AAC.1
MDNAADRGDYLHLVDDRDVITVMEPDRTTTTRCIGQKVIDVVCSNDIVLYQRYMGGVDRGDHLLNPFIAWNLSVDARQKKQRGGKLNRCAVLKWEFYAAVTEEMITYMDEVNNNDNNT